MSEQPQELSNVHIEHYFPKGYNPDDEPWKSIKAHHNAALAAANQATAYDKGYEDCRKLWKQELEVERYIELQRQFLYSEETKEFSQLREQLAAERESRERWNQWCHNAQAQLATERENVKTLTDALNRIKEWHSENGEPRRIIDDALAKVKAE
jgi:hypothetical protein